MKIPSTLIIIISCISLGYCENSQTAFADSIKMQMNDTSASYGLVVYSGKQVLSESVSDASSLVGKSIDMMVVDLKKGGSPSGIVQVGIFNDDLSSKRLFGTINSSSLSNMYKQYAFKLPSSQNYEIQSGDRIGIKFSGGNASNFVAIMTDQSNLFDGINSYLSYHSDSWQSFTNADLFMVLSLHEYDFVPTVLPTVSVSPLTGVYNSSQSAVIKASVPSTIYYTTDGSNPTTASTNHPTPVSLLINSNSTLKFFAKDESDNISPTSSVSYTIISRHTCIDGSVIPINVSCPVIIQSSGKYDKFGISMLNPTTVNGRVWNSNWFKLYHSINSGAFDPNDSEFQARGNGVVTVNGDGTATLNGSAPRMYVQDPTLQKKWKNVEITIYAKRESEQSQVSSQGISAGVRSGSHNDVAYPNICKDNTGYPNSAYNGRLTYDGRADYVKEVLYHEADSVSSNGSNDSPKTVAAFSNFSTPLDPSSKLHTMPKNTWIGYKLITRNTNNDSAVKLETWMDLTDGKNGGNWKKVNEYTDKGRWNATYFYKQNSTWPCSTVPKDNVMTYPMPYIFVRADAVKEIIYKSFSIREINPISGIPLQNNGIPISSVNNTATQPQPVLSIISASPAAGPYHSVQSVTLVASIPNSVIYYTTDGSNPTTSSTNGPSPISGIVINSNSTIKFFAKDGLGNMGPMGSAQYVIVLSVIIPMNDTTVTYGLKTNSGVPIQAEYVSDTSSLVGKSIDTIVINLKKVGLPTGLIQVGVFNSDQSIRQLFGIINTINVTTSHTTYSFSLPKQIYQIQSGDRIGIKFTGGDASNYVAIMTDQSNTFDETNSYLTNYATGWKNLTAKDLYMVLKFHS